MYCQISRVLSLVAAMVLVAPAIPTAHEVPATVTVQSFLRPDGDRLRLLVRVPLESMRDVEIPVRGAASASGASGVVAYLDLTAVQPLLHDAATLWIARYITVLEDDRELPTGEVTTARIALPSDASFRNYASALASFDAAPLDADIDLPWQQALLDVMIELPISSADSRFSIDPELAHLGIRTTTVLRFVSDDGAERAFMWTGNPGLVRLDPRWHQAAFRFVALGFEHILGGLDHLLFLLCLVIPFRRVGPLIVVVTAFTVAHSITLIASAAGLAPDALWFAPLIESLIALSIVYMAFENIVGARPERRWVFAFVFGLVHGFGFSFLLRDSLQFAGSHLITSLLAFNVGVELGQLVVLLIAVPLLALLFRHVVAERIGTILMSALIAHTAWHWMTERGSALLEHDIVLPTGATLGVVVMRALMIVLVIGGVLWGANEVGRRLSGGSSAGTAPG